jgi:sugar lactone lactonase YvrE
METLMTPHAPPVDGQAWLTTEAIAWDDLRGRAVIIVFWSFGCEASLLRIRQIEAIADDAGDDLVAIAVHTPRFPFEEHLAAVRSAVAQHRIAIPVVHDPEFITWSRYNPEGWPATVVIDPRGKVLGTQWGTHEPTVITDSVALALADDHASPEPRPPLPSATPLPLPDGDLAFPTSVTTRVNGELVVADSAHDRLLVFELSDNDRRAVAVAEIDGFDQPNAIVADDGDGIFVAERSMGRVSYLDLARRHRRILTGHLVAPTSLCLDTDGSLVVTDGGADKIYRIIDEGAPTITMGCIAGTGRTGTVDGAAAEAELAQPVGMTRTETGLVFCDAASSNVRLLTDRGQVATITGNGFFEWGLVDGPAHKAMLQRPSDLVVLEDGSLVVVDTGNNRLRRLVSRRIRTLGLTGLDRPSGICLLPSGRLVVADTGKNRLVVVDTDLHTAWVLDLQGVLPPPDPAELAGVSSPGA